MIRVSPLFKFTPSSCSIHTTYLQSLTNLSIGNQINLRSHSTISQTNRQQIHAVGSVKNSDFLYDSPIHSKLESNLRQLLHKLTADGKITGIQVCAYKDGEVVIDSVAGVLGEDDPRPVQHDSLFSVFSATKGITAGMLHSLIDNGKVELDENVATIWPGFGINGKESIKVHHALNHTTGLHSAMSKTVNSSTWKECLDDIVAATPESEPGHVQLYHFASFGWLCGGIIEYASGKKFQDFLHQEIVRPLNIEGEIYIGIPPGVESRLASLTPDIEEFKLIESLERPELPSTFQPSYIAKNIHNFCKEFNSLEVRQAIVPAANGHVTARALARYYATLATGGTVPLPYPPSSSNDNGHIKIYQNPMIHNAFLGLGEYVDFARPDGSFGLGFKRYPSEEGLNAFGHSGMGGSVGFCDVKCNFAIAVAVNKLSLGAVTGRIVELVCSELGVPVPKDFVDKGAYIKVN